MNPNLINHQTFNTRYAHVRDSRALHCDEIWVSELKGKEANELKTGLFGSNRQRSSTTITPGAHASTSFYCLGIVSLPSRMSSLMVGEEVSLTAELSGAREVTIVSQLFASDSII